MFTSLKHCCFPIRKSLRNGSDVRKVQSSASLMNAEHPNALTTTPAPLLQNGLIHYTDEVNLRKRPKALLSQRLSESMRCDPNALSFITGSAVWKTIVPGSGVKMNVVPEKSKHGSLAIEQGSLSYQPWVLSCQAWDFSFRSERE